MHIGRLTSWQFAVGLLIFFIIFGSVMYGFGSALNAGSEGSPLLVPLIILMDIPLILLYIGRLHDTGYSGWWTVLIIFTSLLGMVVLAAYRGEKTTNKYGEVPPRTLSHLFRFWRG